jgi:hybrid cluster-associated redox disulfide protein
MTKITGDMTIAEIIRSYPEVSEVLADNFHVGCLGCLMAEKETLAEGAEHHGVKIEKLLNELNKKLEE